MPRPKKCRKVCCKPEVICFKPAGIQRKFLESVTIDFDEFEAFKLVAYDRLPQEEAALRMEISRPTLTRMYNASLVKIAKALIEGNAIEINSVNQTATEVLFNHSNNLFENQ